MGQRRRDRTEVFGQRERQPRRSLIWLLALVAVLALVATACGSDDEASDAGAEAPAAQTDDAGSDESADFEVEEAAEEEAMEDEEFADDADESLAPVDTATQGESDGESGTDGSLGAGGTRVTPTAADLGRKLIFTAFVNVEVDDVAAASAEATSIIEEMGGFLFGQNTSGGAQPSSELIFKVLPDDFNRALEQLGTVGELRNQSVTTDDVTERIVDLESRIEVADLGVARLRAALEGSETLEDYAEIERLLLSRESDLEVMRGQLRTLQDRVDLATITLTLTQDRVENAMDVRVSVYEDFDEGQSCPGQQLGSVEADSEVTICFEILNVGDQTLTEIVLTDSVLDIDSETELITVFGSLEELAPGQSALVAYETKPERTLRLRTRVVAIPTDGVTSEQAGPTVSTPAEYELRTFEPDTDPGFGDGFSVAVAILSGLWIALRWTLGFLIPLLILVPFVWLAWKGLGLLRDRMPKREKAPSYRPGPGPGAGGAMPPPPQPNPGSAPAGGPANDAPADDAPDGVGSGAG